MQSGQRRNGFQTPLSRDQVTSWVLQPLMFCSFIAFVAKLLDGPKRVGILIPSGLLIALILGAWYICERRDPSEEKPKSGLSVLPVPPKMTRYCTLCCKTSPGLDHHCTWLNTCIADNNYEAFYVLVVAATLQTLLQAIVGILMATVWFHDIKGRLSGAWETPLLVLLWVHNAISLSLANSYLLLAGFHTYLLVIRSGTYDFILENGSDGICARMLKCRCFLKAKTKKRSKVLGPADKKRRSVKKPPSGKVTAAPGSGDADSDRSPAALAPKEDGQPTATATGATHIEIELRAPRAPGAASTDDSNDRSRHESHGATGEGRDATPSAPPPSSSSPTATGATTDL